MELIVNNNTVGHYNVPKDTYAGICIDVGANVGNFLEKIHNKFSLIHYYEPYKQCFDIIQYKFQLFNNILGYNEAAFNQSDLYMDFYSHFNKQSHSSALKTDATNHHWDSLLCKVKTFNLEKMLDRIGNKQLHYLKVDCETGEYYFLNKQDLSKIKYIGIELHWQMGIEKYNELINHILNTHHTDENYEWELETNKEILFKNKILCS